MNYQMSFNPMSCFCVDISPPNQDASTAEMSKQLPSPNDYGITASDVMDINQGKISIGQISPS
jgi:hypothetical protein